MAERLSDERLITGVVCDLLSCFTPLLHPLFVLSGPTGEVPRLSFVSLFVRNGIMGSAVVFWLVREGCMGGLNG